jgi:phosphoribosylformimino-5-aminoimidazole carboxamide ribotide isomerase
MIAFPAVDLRAGHAVQLVGGVPGTDRVRLPDPVAVARSWVAAGFGALHVVDLDAALGTGDNRAIVSAILTGIDVPVQVGGGVRDESDVASLLEAGATRVMVGTRAIEDPSWLRRIAERWPDRIIVAADVRGGLVVTRGWTRTTRHDVESLLAAIEDVPVAAVLVTDVSREGRMQGIDNATFTRIARFTEHAVMAAGGISNLEDLRVLDRAGIAGAVLGMSLYTGAIEARAAATEFAS